MMSTMIKALTVVMLFGLMGCSQSTSSAPAGSEVGHEGQVASFAPSVTSSGDLAEMEVQTTTSASNGASALQRATNAASTSQNATNTASTTSTAAAEPAEDESALAAEAEGQAEQAISNGNYLQALAQLERELATDEGAIESTAE